jgi:hypothetical protein
MLQDAAIAADRMRPGLGWFAVWLGLLAGLGGCQDIRWTNWGRSTASAPSTSQTEPATAPVAQNAPTPLSGVTLRPIVVLTVDFSVLRVRAAAGTFSQSEKIWNPIQEEMLPAQMRMMLRNNGLRIGVGKHSTWPQIKAALDAEKVEISTNQQTLQNGVPLTVEINAVPRDQTLFLIRSDGTMPGAFFPQSTNGLRIEYWIPPSSADTVMMELMPEIRLLRNAGQSNLAVAALQNPSVTQPTRPLRELAVRIAVGPDEFLAIGPSSVAQQNHLAGSLLLVEEINGHRLESMCFITPKILSVPMPTTP